MEVSNGPNKSVIINLYDLYIRGFETLDNSIIRIISYKFPAHQDVQLFEHYGLLK